MAKYRHKKTKAILETSCKISGGDWVEVKARGNSKTAEESPEQVQEEQVQSEQQDPENGTPAEGDGDE